MDTISIQKGQWVPMRLTFWADTDKTSPVDLTGAVVTVNDASQPILLELAPALSEPENGVVDLTLWEEQSRQLETGRVNWMKLEAQFTSTNIQTPKIWFNVHE